MCPTSHPCRHPTSVCLPPTVTSLGRLCSSAEAPANLPELASWTAWLSEPDSYPSPPARVPGNPRRRHKYDHFINIQEY